MALPTLMYNFLYQNQFNMSNCRPIAAMLFLFFITTFKTPAQDKPDTLKPKMDSIFKKYNTRTGPGCAIGVIRNNQLIYSGDYGMANLEYDIPINPSTIFDIASVSKQFTGLAISTLIQQGKISLDDDIRKYLSDVPQFGKTITVRHLLHHISGIRDWPQTLNAAGWRFDEVFSFKDIMRMVKYQKDLDFDPGAQFSYSNTGFNLLAAIVEKISGVSFVRWTDSNIFRPLGMNHSHFVDDYTRIIKNLAYSYTAEENGFGKVPGSLTAYGSSSLFTSVEDLSKWVINFQKQLDASNPVYLRMLDDGVLNNGRKVHYGYGLGLGDDGGLKNISHTGGWAGYRTIISNYPTEKISVIILSNSSDFQPGDYAHQVANIFLRDKFKGAERFVNLKDSPTVKVDTAILRKYTGTYSLRPGWIITITLENGALMTQANGEDKFPTAAKSDSIFWVDAYREPITFISNKNGPVNMLRYRDMLANRIIPWVPDMKKFDEYAGDYYSEELSSQFKIDLVAGKLVMHHMRLGDLDLSVDPSGPEQFSSQVGSIRFFRDDHQKIIGFKLSGGRVKNLQFDKK
jgi:CubicO group peptidase (beta-lactamase class C family)